MEKNNWEKIEALFHAGKALPESARSAFLDVQCGADEDLRQSVASLLEHADKEPELDAVVQHAAHSLLSEKHDLTGQRIGAYLVTGELGQGGMGAVYLAERADDQYRQKVAIKLIRAGAASDEVMRRFRVERQILANLEHPYIARLLDGGTTESGLPYLVMEYIEGEPVDVYCNSRNLSIRERLRLFRRVCDAVQYAHQNLIVHRDLKPSNLLVTDKGEPRLLDFGIAKLLDTAETDQTVLETRAGVRLLTPQYSSPEQIRGEPVSTVTDVYALGIILYELIMREVLDKASMQLEQGEHPLASQPAIEAAVRRVIGSIYSDLGILPSAEVHLERALQIHRKNEQADQKELLLALIDLGGLYHLQFREKERQVLNIQALELSKQIYGETHRHTLGAMNNLASVYQMNGQLDAAEKLFSDVYEKRMALLGEDHRDTLSSANNLGVIYHWLGRFSEATRYYRLCLEQSRRLLGENHTQTLRCIESLGSVLETSGEYAAAEPVISEHIERATLILGEMHPSTLRSMHNLADTYRGLERYQESEDLFLKTLDARKQALGNDHIETLQTQMKLARLLRLMSRYDEAEPLVKDTVEKQRATLGFVHPTTLIAAQELADLYREKNQIEEALALYQPILQAREEVLGEDHPELHNTLTGLARIHLARHENTEAEMYLQRALKLADENPDFKSQDIPGVLQMLIQFYESIGAPQQAAPYRDRLSMIESKCNSPF